jgi:hypothetical protein
MKAPTITGATDGKRRVHRVGFETSRRARSAVAGVAP